MGKKVSKERLERLDLAKSKTESITLRTGESSGGWKAEPETVARVQEVAKRISDGQSRQTLIPYIQDTYKLSYSQARKYYSAAMRYLIPDDEEEYRRGLIQANIDRLETIIEECMTNNRNLKIAREAIDSLNKMIGAGGNSVTIAKNTKGEEIINITWD